MNGTPDKRCRKCKVVKAHWLFSTDRRNKDGLDCYCLECRRVLALQRRARERSVDEWLLRLPRITERDTGNPRPLDEDDDGGAR